MLEENDPDVPGLEVERRTWICRAGPIIRDSKALRKIHIIIDSGETDGTWIGELLQHLRRNRSIESLAVHLRPTIYFRNDIMTNSHYDYQHEWDIFHILTSFIGRNKNLCNIELYWGTVSMLDSLALALARCKNKRSLQRIELQYMKYDDENYMRLFASLTEFSNLLEICIDGSDIGPLGVIGLAKVLQSPASKIRTLKLMVDAFDGMFTPDLINALIRNNSVKSLDLRKNREVGAQAWGIFSAVLFHPLCTIEKLWLSGADINNNGVTYLGEALAFNKSLTHLDLSYINAITYERWEGFLKYMRNPDLALKELVIGYCCIDGDGAGLIMRSLRGNTSLTRLDMRGNNNVLSDGLVAIFYALLGGGQFLEELDLRDNVDTLNEEHWLVLSRALCDKSSTDSTYFDSNHMLHTIEFDYDSQLWFSLMGIVAKDEGWDDDLNFHTIWSDIESSLEMNRGESTDDVSRRKILKHHFTGEVSDVQVFAWMPETVLPNVIEWIGRSRDARTYSIMFNVVQGMPALMREATTDS